MVVAQVKYPCTGSGTTSTILPVLYGSHLDVLGLGMFGTGGKLAGLF